MAPMTSSVASMRSVSELSDVDLDSSTHSDFSTTHLQAPAFAPGVRALARHWGTDLQPAPLLWDLQEALNCLWPVYFFLHCNCILGNSATLNFRPQTVVPTLSLLPTSIVQCLLFPSL